MIVSQLCGSLALLLVSFNEPAEPLSCGQASCYLLLTRLQVPVAMADLDQDFANLPTEASFRELQTVLERHGVAASSWKLDWDDVRSIRGPFIAHLNDPKRDFRHYHLAEWRDSGLVILDPLAANPIEIGTGAGLETYRKAITGYVLVPSTGVPSSWQWRSRLRMGSIVLVGVVAVFWVVLHRRSVRSRLPA